ncbi:MAG TPA: 4-(cytidine 5'-diphospho)-2-C-methyl-D-erythritol kinase [Terriglobales bacterium]|jgi:4-diphosphocytidyl-2-C-methyl-D-erythritol kinase
MVSIPSFAKINLGLKIGPARPDGFHELRTVYQTLALHDVIRVGVESGEGIEIRCNDPRVPLDQTNTCYKVAERVLAIVQESKIAAAGQPQVPRLRPVGSARDDNSLAEGMLILSQPGVDANLYGTAQAARVQHEIQGARRGRVVIEIEKRLPVQGGMGAASSNGVATMLGLERALGIVLAPQEKLRIAAEVGSDLPLFLIGGTVLGVGRGEEVFPLPDLPPLHVVVITPPVGVSTPGAFARWDELNTLETALTGSRDTGTINKFSQSVFAWLSAGFPQVGQPMEAESDSASGVPARGGDRAETPLLDLVRAGIENDFETVVFSEYPDLREVKALLLREGARYASLSGSGSTLYGLFASEDEAQAAAKRMSAAGHAAVATRTLTRDEYWKAIASN